MAALNPDRELTLLGQRTHAASESETLSTSVDLEIHSRHKLNVTTVTELFGREDQVDERLRAFLGSPEPEPGGPGWLSGRPSASATVASLPSSLPPATPWAPSPSPPRSRSPTDSISSRESETLQQEEEGDPFPSTQEMGTSSLASQYARPPQVGAPLSSQSGSLLPQAPPILGLTQQQRDEFQKREATQRRRDAIAASQAEPSEPNEGGFHLSSQVPRESRESSTPSTPTRRPLAPQRKPLSPISTHSPFRAGGSTRDPGCLPKSSGSGARRRAIFAALGS